MKFGVWESASKLYVEFNIGLCWNNILIMSLFDTQIERYHCC
jgi:hypothetical protein